MPYSSDDLTRLVQDDHTRQVIGLEDQIAASILRDTDATFAVLIRRTLEAWTRAFGGANRPAVPGTLLDRIISAARSAAVSLLDNLASRGPAVLDGGLARAVVMGAEQGTAFVRAATGGRVAEVLAPQATRTLRDEARRIRDVVHQRRDRALFLLRSDRVSRWSQLLDGLGAARAALAAVRAHVAWVINTAVHEGLDAVVRATSGLRVWVSEADACVRCLAYTGRTAKPGEPFPGGLSWDPRQRRTHAAAVDGPPLHPHCRCRAVPWDDTWPAVGVPFPEALRREAERAIGYGRSRPSESPRARLRAARELLRTVDDLLPAVETTARTALQTGRFPAAA